MALEVQSFTSPLVPNLGGLGVSNNAASTVTISGSFPLTLTLTGASSVTFPTSGTLVASGAITGSGLTMATSRLLGRTTFSSGAVEEITVGSGLTLSAGTLSATGSGGTVTSVSFTGGIVSVATATTTPALTVAGTSGGVVYFSSSSAWASSGALTANAVVLGGGAGNPPATVAGFTTDGTSVLTLGVAGTSVGSVAFKNATSGTITLSPTTGALGTVTQTLQAVTGTIYCTGGTDVAVADGGTALSSIAALSLLVANSANVYVALTPGAGNSIRINAGGTAWEAYTPGSSGANTALSNLAAVSINTSLIPQAGVDLGAAATAFRDIYFYSGGTFGSHSIKLMATPTGNRTATFPDASTFIISASQAITLTGPTAARTYQFPDANSIIARIDAGQTFTGNQIFTTAVSTGTGSTAGIQVTANSLTTGNGVDISSSSVSTGNIVKIASTSTAANANALTGLLIDFTGANANSSQTVTCQRISIINTGTLSTNIALSLNAQSATNNYALICTAGSVGIGTSTPAAQLHTTGTVRLANFGAGTATFDASGNVSSVSDERLKKIQGYFTRGLESLKEIKPILYKWTKESGMETEMTYAGMSAQNVQRGIPEAVNANQDGWLGLSDRAIIGVLVNACNQLRTKVEELETRAASVS